MTLPISNLIFRKNEKDENFALKLTFLFSSKKFFHQKFEFLDKSWRHKGGSRHPTIKFS